MVEESDVVGFLKDHDGQASIDEISEGLGVPKYGPDSAYALLQSVRSNGVVNRRGEMWVLLAPEAVRETSISEPVICFSRLFFFL